MGKEPREIKKSMKGVGNLEYVEIRNVPFVHYEGYGDSVGADVLSQIERMVAKELILRKLPIRGMEVEFFRSVLGLSQRQFAEKLKLSHVAVLKWEKAKYKELDLVNEVAVKALIAGLLPLKLPASLETLTSKGESPSKLVLDYSSLLVKRTKLVA